MKNPVAIARLVIKHGTSFGAGVATTAVIRNNMAMHSNPIIKGCQYMGIFGASGVVGEAASNYAVRQFDELLGLAKELPSTTTKN